MLTGKNSMKGFEFKKRVFKNTVTSRVPEQIQKIKLLIKQSVAVKIDHLLYQSSLKNSAMIGSTPLSAEFRDHSLKSTILSK